MKNFIKKGVGFGLTSGIITTLGLIIGLYFGLQSRVAIIGGILIIAFADSMSDALGIHISEETNKNTKEKEIWGATISTFISKIIFSGTFIIPFTLLSLKIAVIISLIWGILLISLFSFYLAHQRKEKAYKIVLEHVVIMVSVIIASYVIGKGINLIFGS